MAAAHAALAQSSPTVTAIDAGSEPSYHFDPQTITVAPGATFVFKGGQQEPHTLTHDTQGTRLFDSGAVEPGNQTSITAPSAAGSYPFHCLFHGGMKGTLVVQSAGATTPATTSSTPSSPPAKTPALPLAGALGAALVVATLMRRKA